MTADTREKLLDAALNHVPFDGWSQATLDAACADTGIDPQEARALFPRGPVDLALAYHQRGDDAMVARMAATDMTGMRYRDRIALGVRLRLEVADREAVRRGMALFSLPQYSALGAAAVWGTADRIWNALGDTSRDINWYTKRATLAAVYSATVLFWLGDDSPGNTATWEFLDRRIDDVMKIEGLKARVRDTGLFQALMRGPGRILDNVKAPKGNHDDTA